MWEASFQKLPMLFHEKHQTRCVGNELFLTSLSWVIFLGHFLRIATLMLIDAMLFGLMKTNSKELRAGVI